MTRFALLFFAALIAGTAAAADVSVSDAWIRVLPGDAPAGGYFVLRNNGDRPIVLTGADSPDYGHIMMHMTTEKGGMSAMRAMKQVEIPAHGKVTFAPGGRHLMLMHARHPIEPGASVPITLELKDGGKVPAVFEARGPAGH